MSLITNVHAREILDSRGNPQLRWKWKQLPDL